MNCLTVLDFYFFLSGATALPPTIAVRVMSAHGCSEAFKRISQVSALK